MKKYLKKLLKNWRIGDFLRQFTIVTGGVLLTLWLSGRITESSRQKEVRQAIRLISYELRDNLRIIENCEALYNEEKRVALRLQEERFSTAALPADTVMAYSQTVASEVKKPFEFSTDALEMFKTSGIASHISDKELVTRLLRCYKSLASFDNIMNSYYDERRIIFMTQKELDLRQGADYRSVLDKTIADKRVQSWLYLLPRAFNKGLFDMHKEIVGQTVSELEKFRE